MADQQQQLLDVSDLDPERWKPMFYSMLVEVPVAEGGIGRGSITTNNQPYIFTHISHAIVGNTYDPETSGLYDDGQYLINWRDEVRAYSKEPILASLLFGPKFQGDWQRLPYSVYYAGNHTVSFDLTNTYTRILTPVSATFKVQIALRGLADWGALQPQH
jgi:hypothetical protein